MNLFNISCDLIQLEFNSSCQISNITYQGYWCILFCISWWVGKITLLPYTRYIPPKYKHIHTHMHCNHKCIYFGFSWLPMHDALFKFFCLAFLITWVVTAAAPPRRKCRPAGRAARAPPPFFLILWELEDN